MAIEKVEEQSKVILVLSDEAVENYMQMNKKLTDSFQKWLVPEVDYTTKLFGRGSKPSLLDPGAGKLIGFFQCRPRHRILERHYDMNEEGFETIRYAVACEIINEKLGLVVSEGVGSCTSNEVRYKYRWYYSRELRQMGYKEDEIKALPQRKRGQSPVFRARNPEVPDLDNTIFKMAAKRAEVDATLQLPGVGACFTQDIGTARTSHQEPSEEERKIKQRARADREELLAKKKEPPIEKPTDEPAVEEPKPEEKPIDEPMSEESKQEEESPKGLPESVEDVTERIASTLAGYSELVVISDRGDYYRIGRMKMLDTEIENHVDFLVSEMGGEFSNETNEWRIPKISES